MDSTSIIEQTRMKKTTIILFTIPLWLVNPLFTGCAEENKYEFGEAEMLDLLDTLENQTWITTINGTDHELFLDMEQSPEEQAALMPSILGLGSAHACEDRTFFASAEACIQSTTLYIEGSAQVINLETEEVLHESLPLNGSILVLGYTLDNADIRVTHETGFIIWHSNDGESIIMDGATW